MSLLLRTTRTARRVLLALLVAIVAVVFIMLALSGASVPAEAGPGHGHAGEHGRHKGRPFRSPTCPEGGTCP